MAINIIQGLSSTGYLQTDIQALSRTVQTLKALLHRPCKPNKALLPRNYQYGRGSTILRTFSQTINMMEEVQS